MTDHPSAAERAREVIRSALLEEEPRRYADGRLKARSLSDAELVLDALLAHPSLVAALAIEVGGLELVGDESRSHVATASDGELYLYLEDRYRLVKRDD